MVTNQKHTGRACSMPVGLVYGGVTSLIVTLISVLGLAKLLHEEILEWENVGYGIMAVLVLSAVLGGYVAFKNIKRQRVVVYLLAGAVYFAILICITALFFGGQFEAVGVTALLVFGGSAAAALTRMENKRRKGYKKPRVASGKIHKN